MVNAEKFRSVFGTYATEVWTMSQAQFLEWLNAESGPALADPNRLTDGTLIVNVGKVDDVRRVLVQEGKTHKGGLFYRDSTDDHRSRKKA